MVSPLRRLGYPDRYPPQARNRIERPRTTLEHASDTCVDSDVFLGRIALDGAASYCKSCDGQRRKTV